MSSNPKWKISYYTRRDGEFSGRISLGKISLSWMQKLFDEDPSFPMVGGVYDVSENEARFLRKYTTTEFDFASYASQLERIS